MPHKCFYELDDCSTHRSREHVISASVLKAVFGDPIQNVVSGDLLGTKRLIDHEPVLKDVCARCNSALSECDVAGAEFVKKLIPVCTATGLKLPFHQHTLGWILKTHFNYLRLIVDSETREPYPVAKELKQPLIADKLSPLEMFTLLIEGFEGRPYLWNASHPKKISWIHYRSVRFRAQHVVLSSLQTKCLETWLLLPSDASYTHFDARVYGVLEEVRRNFGFAPERVDIAQALKAGALNVSKVLPFQEFKRFIRETVPANPSVQPTRRERRAADRKR